MKEFKAEYRVEGHNKFAKYGSTIITASSHKEALAKFIKENGIKEEDFVEMTSEWIDINLPAVTCGYFQLKKYIDIAVRSISLSGLEVWYAINKPEYKNVCDILVCKDANGNNIRPNFEIMCHIEENGEVHECHGYVVETLPDNKIKINITEDRMLFENINNFNTEDRIMIVNAKDCHSLEFEF